MQKVCTSTVLTIGHSTWKVFLDLLRAHRVERVIDVRSIPRSRHNPQFDQDTLRRKLRAARISYVHLRKLGGSPQGKVDLRPKPDQCDDRSEHDYFSTTQSQDSEGLASEYLRSKRSSSAPA
jgi:hypothetical protein